MSSILVERMIVFKTWSKRGFPATVSKNPESWTMSFVVALPKDKLEGILAITDSIVTKSF